LVFEHHTVHYNFVLSGAKLLSEMETFGNKFNSKINSAEI